MFKLDRNSFEKYSHLNNKKGDQFYQHLELNERLRIAFYLNSVAYQFPMNDPPKLDKTLFKKRKSI